MSELTKSDRHDAAPVGELFGEDAVASDSPRRLWLARHGLATRDNGQAGEDELGEFGRWLAWRIEAGIRYGGPRRMPGYSVGHGDTEDEALADWARKNGKRMWFEEGCK